MYKCGSYESPWEKEARIREHVKICREYARLKRLKLEEQYIKSESDDGERGFQILDL